MPSWHITTREKCNKKVCYEVFHKTFWALHLVFCNDLLTILLFLHAVIKLFVILRKICFIWWLWEGPEVRLNPTSLTATLQKSFFWCQPHSKSVYLSCLQAVFIFFLIASRFEDVICLASESSYGFNAWRVRMRCFKKTPNLILYTFGKFSIFLFTL